MSTKLTALTAIRELVAENARLRAALVDAIELADEGWAYAGDYVTVRWAATERLAALRAVMPIISAGETVDENLGKPETPDLMSALQASLEHVPPGPRTVKVWWCSVHGAVDLAWAWDNDRRDDFCCDHGAYEDKPFCGKPCEVVEMVESEGSPP